MESQLLNDNVSIVARCPEIPVGGRLTHFLTEWESITSDKWVLDLIREGYKLEFIRKPSFRGIKETVVPSCQTMLLEKEIENLLSKNAIERVQKKDTMKGFYSTLFLVPKKNGKMRPVINLRPLNRYLVKKHFKMDSMKKVIQLVEKGDWSITLDLADAYFHLKIFKYHRQYLRFSFKGKVFQFRVLSFGPTVAPRVFSKVTSVLAAYLRQQSIRLATYLDDWLVLNQIRKLLSQNRFIVLSLLFRLGFIINKEKSNLLPSQDLTYIGGHFLLAKGLVFPTLERVQGLRVSVQHLLQGYNTARDYLVLLGKIASCLEMIPNARLFMRPIQLHLLQNWSPIRMSMDYKIPVPPWLKPHLRWWLQEANILKGQSVQPIQFTETVTTDASLVGWGGHMNNLTVQGLWSNVQKMSHINCLEMEAVYLTVKHFLPYLINKNVLIQTDNSTVTCYLNHQGGTKSLQLWHLTWKLWSLVLENNIYLKSVHIAGKKNFLEDTLSRQGSVLRTEWSMNNSVVSRIFHLWDCPMMDLFATFHNKKTQLFCSWMTHQKAFAIDAMSISWQNMFAYAFPPIQMIPRVLQHMKRYHCKIILIAPHWPRQFWFPILLNMLVDFPIKLPPWENLLSQAKGKTFHPDPKSLNLTAWLLSTDISLQERRLESYWHYHGERAQERITLQNLSS